MPRKTKSKKPVLSAKQSTKGTHAMTPRAADPELVFLNIPISPRLRSALNRLVDIMEVSNQRQVIEHLVTEELHRRNLRLPRAG